MGPWNRSDTFGLLSLLVAIVALAVSIGALSIARNQLTLAANSLSTANAMSLTLEASRLIDEIPDSNDIDEKKTINFFERFVLLVALSKYLEISNLIDKKLVVSLSDDFCTLYGSNDRFVGWWRHRQDDDFLNSLYPDIQTMGEECEIE